MPKIVNLGTPTSPTIYTHKYNTFRGVDFSLSETTVDDSRSPYAQNLISDTGGFPEKRLGWRTVQTLDGRINGIYHYRGLVRQDDETEELVDRYIIHAGTKIYSWSGSEEDEPEELMSGVNDARSTGRCFDERLFILTGAELLEYNGKTCVDVSEGDGSYVPTTWQGRGSAFLADDNTGEWNSGDAGQMYQDINIAGQKRKNTFRIDNDWTYAQRYLFLDGKIRHGTRLVMTYIPTGEVLLDIIAPEGEDKDTYKEPQGFWTYSSETTSLNQANVDIGCNWASGIGTRAAKTLGLAEGGVIAGVMKPSKIEGYVEPAEGEDNFCVEYVAEVGKIEGAISKCTIMDIFENRIFYSGNPDYPNTDWHSELNEPTYVTDLSYTEIGMDSSAIVGYLRTGDKQAILKSDGDDATIYMRSYSSLGDGSVIFPVKQGTSGIGAIAKNAVCTFLDDPLYLTRNGVYAIAMQDISSERALNLRSTRINNRLLSEKELTDAVMCEWNGYLVLCVGECAYVADAAQKSYSGNKTGTFEYEWYYWTNIPARVIHENDGALYFGTEDGRICRFNDDMKNDRGEIVPTAYSDDGEAIVAEWATNLSDDGDFMRLKTMKKKGSGVMLKTYNRSGVKVLIRTDKDFGNDVVEILGRSVGVFSWDDIDFNDFTFNTSEYMVVPFNSKFKKYKAIQVICRNDKVNQAFGVLGIIRRYVIGNFAK